MIEPRLLHDTATESAERRLYRRLPAAVQIELRVKENPVPIRLKTTDISPGGCYVEMAITVEPGTSLDVVLWLDHEKLSLQGRVATRHPQFGNGIEFISVSPESENRLQRFLDAAENSRVI